MKQLDFQHDQNRVSKTLDFTANGPGVVYSGPGNEKRATNYAHVNNVKTIADTEGGRYLGDRNRYKEYGVDNARKVWGEGSIKYVSTLKGNVTTFVAGARPEAVFRDKEIKPLVENKDITKINGVDRSRFEKFYGRTYQEALKKGMSEDNAKAHASTQTCRGIAVAELRQTRKEAYQSANKKKIEDYQNRKSEYLNQRVDDKQANAKRQGVAYTGPEKKTPEQRALDIKIGTRNMYTRASLDKNIREGHVSKQEAPKEKARIEKTLSEYAKSDRSAFQAQDTSKSFARASGSSKAVAAPSVSAPKAKAI